MQQNTNDFSAVDKNNKKHLSLSAQTEYFLSFVVIFKESNTSDFLRVFGNNKIINEVQCDSKVKVIDVPIKFQNNLQFEMFSNQNNQCQFYFVSLSREVNKSYRSKRICFLFTKTDWSEDTYLKDLAYAGTMFGHKLHGKIAHPDKNRIKFSAGLNPLDSPHHEKIWFDSITGKKYIRITGGNWIAKFRPGYACLYRKNKNQIYNVSPLLNIFNNIAFFPAKNLVQLTKSTGKNLILPVDHLLRFKKIQTEEQYLDFVHDSLIFYPAIVCNWFDFKL